MGRNYLDLCNEVLSELVYEEVATFEELDDITEGKKVKRELNKALRQICNNEQRPWKFRQRTVLIPLVGGIQQYEIPNGYIRYIRYPETPIKLEYMVNHDTVIKDVQGLPLTYWTNDNNLVLYPTPDDTQTGKVLEVHLLTYDYAVDCCGLLKPIMDSECDEPIIPEHHRDVLVYKVCANWRGNVTDARAQYFQAQYKTAYKNLLSDQRLTEDYPNMLDVMGRRESMTSTLYNTFFNPWNGQGYRHN